MAVDADARALRPVAARDRAGRRLGLAAHIQCFRIDAPLHREAAGDGWALRVQTDRGQRLAGGDGDLRSHQVQASDGLCDGVLDLQARVGLDEEKECVLANASRSFFDQELESAQALVGRGAGQRQRGSDQTFTQCLVHARAGRDLHQFLEAPLQRAIAIAQGHDTLPIADHLHLDVTRAPDQAFGVDLADAEG